MYYKLYIDSVFILQLTSNLYLLSLAGRILQCTATHGRILMGAALGALMVCGTILVPAGTVGIRILVSTIPVSMCMLYVTFRICHKRQLIRASLVMAGCGFFLGGTMIWILNRLRTVLKGDVSLVLTLVTGGLSYLVLLKVVGFLRRRKESGLKRVVIHVPEPAREIPVRALLDTGNHLTDPLSGEPVCVISKRLAEEIADCFRPEKYHAVPFRSIGRERGILDAYELPEMMIEDETRQIRKEHVIVAICNTGMSEESIYQMILHPRLLED